MNNLYKKQIKEIVNRYSIGDLLTFKRIKTSGNFSYKIKTNKGNYFLRLCGERLRFRSADNIRGELKLLDLLKKNNFPAHNYETNTNGEVVVTINNKNGFLRKYIDGKQVKGNPTREEIKKVGKILGKYHKLVEKYNAENLRGDVNFGIELTKKYFDNNINDILNSNFPKNREFIKLYQNEINKIILPDCLSKGMIHEDLGKRHVLWKDKKIRAIIDFDRAYYGYLVLDLGQALRGWSFIDDFKIWSMENYLLFIQGYEEERKLSKLEKDSMQAAIKFAILERALAFCAQYVYSSEPKEEDAIFSWASFSQLKLIKI